MYLKVFFFIPFQENCVYETVVLPLDETAFEKTLTPIIQEYFEHGDTNEVAVGLKLHINLFHTGEKALLKAKHI